LTSRFESIRASLNHSPQASSSSNTQTALLASNPSEAPSTTYVLPPQWVDIVEAVQTDLKNGQTLYNQLCEKHAARLRVTFGANEAQLDNEIEVVAGQIAKLMRKCENAVKRIATVSNERGTTLPERERRVRLNVMRSLGAELQDLSQKFRRSRKTFMKRLRGQDEVGREFFQDSSNSTVSLDEALDRGLSQEELQQLEEMNQNASAREQEIINIATSINDLANLFNELNVLVVEQGTVLDRIDYNVEQTLLKVQDGVGHLVKAEEHSSKAYTMKCILFLIIIIIILTAILIFKNVDFSKNN
jgi:syntaxin 16